MFNNIIYFIIVMFLFSVNFPDSQPKHSFLFSFSMIFCLWAFFAGYCRHEFIRLKKNLHTVVTDEGYLSTRYQQLVSRFSILAIVLFFTDIYIFDIKRWFGIFLWFESFSVFKGILALSLFFLYLITIWYFSYPAYNAIYAAGIPRSSFVRSNVMLNVPIIFPWVVLTFIYDLIAFIPLSKDSVWNTLEGQLVSISILIILLMIFMPRVIISMWGCKTLGASDKAEGMRAFLSENRFGYRDIVLWPAFEGRMITAGLMGIVPRYRYILVTESLVDIMTQDELNAVLAHEMGHAKYYHMLLYVFFFLGFMVLSLGLADYFFYFALFSEEALSGFLSDMVEMGDSIFYFVNALPMLMVLFFYFRYVMGFFMRNFERQADLYSVKLMETPRHIISSLEKIAYLSGKSRNLPSWHHFSVKERVECLEKTYEDKNIVKRHDKHVYLYFIIFFLTITFLGYFLNFGTAKQQISFSLNEELLYKAIDNKPDDVSLLFRLALLYQNMEKEPDGIAVYEKILEITPDSAMALNNLAWLLITAKDKGLRNYKRGLMLAKESVSIEVSPENLDTLAEAYYVNGMVHQAILTIDKVLSLPGGERTYFRQQLKKFKASLSK